MEGTCSIERPKHLQSILVRPEIPVLVHTSPGAVIFCHGDVALVADHVAAPSEVAVAELCHGYVRRLVTATATEVLARREVVLHGCRLNRVPLPRGS